MSTISKVNFELVSDTLHVQTRSLPLADPDLADPTQADALVDGEWVTFDASNKAVRAANIASAGNAATAFSWPVFVERGRSDNQALAERKKSVIYLGAWEADVRIFLATSMTVGRLVSVSSIDLGGKIVAGLVDNGTILSPSGGISVGVVTRLPATNGGKLRIRGGMFY